MSVVNRATMTVENAVARLNSIVEDVEAKRRSDADLKGVLVEAILIVDAWKSEGVKVAANNAKNLLKEVEYKQGRRGNIYSLLLRAAFGKDGVDSRKTGGWGKACENLAAHLNRKKKKISKLSVEAAFMKYGVEQARKDEFN